ncbi:MAG TPA: acyl-ACP thioesterase domain-containing protein [Solirubrobacteraceae bacterium]|nr:acyl-ACP thioesterase domain-containing protein [Solirubrobacteraceae bacterium]
MTVSALTELVPRPAVGRVFEQIFYPGFGDCAPSGRLRLDALARWLQDVAYADVVDAELAGRAVWVIRRTRIQVKGFPNFGAPYRVATFCSGMGRMWAERRTSISHAETEESEVEAVSLWVHLDPESWRPIPLSEDEASVYGVSAGGRRVTARLRHPQPNSAPERSTWRFRNTELDLAGHINNAAYWQPLEEELLAGAEPRRIDAEIEFRSPSQPGEHTVLREDHYRWIVGDDGETQASLVVAEVAFGD